MLMRDPQRIPEVMAELTRTWEAQPDVTLAHIWAQVEARGVALNSSDVEVTDALRAVRRDFPFSLSFPDATSEQPTSVLIETEGPTRRVSLNISGDEAWVVVRTPGGSGNARARGNGRLSHSKQTAPEQQPGVWQVSELAKCQAGSPLQLKDMEGNTHRLGVIRLIRAMENSEPLKLSGIRQPDWSGETVLIQLEDDTVILLGRNVRIWEQERREVHASMFRWRRILRCDVGEPCEFTDGSGTHMRFSDVRRILRVD